MGPVYQALPGSPAARCTTGVPTAPSSTSRTRRLVRFERGGHLLVAVEQERLRAMVQSFVREHAGGR